MEYIDAVHISSSVLFSLLKPEGWGIFQSPINAKRDVMYEDFSIT